VFADWGLSRLERLLKPIFNLFEIPVQAFYDLTTANCRAFNEAVPDAPGVRYFSVAGRYDALWRSPEWLLPHQIVLQAEGPNDGIVSLASATYGERCDIWEGDHLSLVNWPKTLLRFGGPCQDRTPAYAELIRRLAEERF
jgi:triacylglycerol lipase